MKPLSFALLFLPCLLYFTPVNSIPAHSRREPQNNSGMVTMSLRRRHVPRSDDLHPRILLQQSINRGSKRLAQVTGREGPSDHSLRAELHKRLYLLESEPGSRSGELGRRRKADPDGTSGRSSMGNSPIGINNGTTSGSSSSSGTNTGISPLDIQGAKNGGVTVAKPPTASDTLGLNIEADDVAYLAVVKIGTPPRNFRLLMDSGSADFWVAGENCQTTQGDCGNHTTLGAQSSSSFVQSLQKFNVTYGSGVVEGLLCQDSVNIAGLQLKNHIFGVATAESIQFAANTTPFDGIMGFAQSSLSQERVPTPVESLAANKLIQAPITSFKIPRLADQLDDGEVTFGGLDPTKFVNETLVTFPNVNTMGFWEGAMDAITVNGASIGLAARTAILDTGTTLILAPPADAQKVIAGLGGACDMQQCVIPCTTTASLALSFGNASFAIDPRDLTVLPIDFNDPTGSCTAGIQPQQVGATTEWLVGDVFLKNVYFSTNVATNQISLANVTKT